MDVSTLKAYIKSNRLPNYIIFAGDEWKVQEIYIQQIAKVTKRNVIRIDSITDIYSKLKNRSFVQKPAVYVVRDDKELMQNEKLQGQIESVLNQNILIHLVTNLDKRTRFYKSFKASICDFERLSDSMLSKYIRKEIKLSERQIQRLIEICEHDYGRILLEIDKIKRYVLSVEYMSDDEAFTDLVNDGTIHVPAKDSIFNFVDAVLDRRCNNLFELLQDCYDTGEPTMVMLSVLYNNAKAVLQVQSYEGNNLSKATGLTGWQIKNAKPHVNKYSDLELIALMKLIQKCEQGIKTGQIEEQYVIEYILARIL